MEIDFLQRSARISSKYKIRNTATRGKMKVKGSMVDTIKTAAKMVWTYEKDDRQQTTEKYVWMDAKRMEEKGKIKTNLDPGYS